MRDPLARLPIRYKLPLGFLAVCVVAFGVGGIVLTAEARKAVESQIDRRLDERAAAASLIVQRHLDLLRRRAEDFASDGFIRHHAAERGDVLPLVQHLQRNKLSLSDELVGAAIFDGKGDLLLVEPATAQADPAHRAPNDIVVGVLRPLNEGHPYPTFAICAPLRHRVTHERIGTLQLIIHATKWAGGMTEMGSLPPLPLHFVRLTTGSDVVLPLPSGGATAPSPTRAPDYQTPLSHDGWRLELAVDRDAAVTPADRLRNQYLWIGLGLLLLTGTVLYFPLRFLLRPLTQVSDAARKVSEGEFKARVDHDAHDEIGDLARAFNVMAGAVEDRTQRLEEAARTLRRREQDVRVERDRLGTVIHSMEDGLFLLNPDGRVTLANAAARPLVSALDEDHVAKLSCGHHRPQPQGCLSCLADVDAGQQACVIERGGRIFEVHTTALPAAPGEARGRLCVSRDVTERIAQQESQAHQERMAVLGEVAAVMAHELNNPLAAIAMFSEMLEEQLEDVKLRENVSIIRRNVAACKRTIHGLLDLAARGRLEIAPFDLTELLEEVVALLNPIIQRGRVRVHLDTGAPHAALVGDEVRLRQVFINLLMNAVQACSDGGDVTISVAQDGDYVEVSVHDTGKGIDPATRDRIFEPFFTTKGPGAGTGLGLPTSKRIVEEHGGALDCPAVETGTTFRVRLPRSAARPAWEARARLQAEVNP